MVGADIVKDEITAQAKAAMTLDPDVDTVFEIGGQDSKFIRTRTVGQDPAGGISLLFMTADRDMELGTRQPKSQIPNLMSLKPKEFV